MKMSIEPEMKNHHRHSSIHIITSKTIENRRAFIRKLAAAGGFYSIAGLYAEALTISPQVTQGPYYPLAQNVPLDKDNDLIYLNDSLTPATGLVSYITGRALDSSGNPIKGALVELWHADYYGNYIYSSTSSRNSAADPNFQGFGQFLTGSTGQYKFRTIKAGLYTPRARHYHLAVTVPGQLTRYCTQLFWNETAYQNNGTLWVTQNAGDMVFSALTSAQQAAVNLTYSVVDQTTGAVGAYFDFIPNVTPVEPTYPAGTFLVSAQAVAGPTNSQRFMISIPAYTNYTYEIYGNPNLAAAGALTNLSSQSSLTNLGWGSLPFATSQLGDINTNKYTASANGQLALFLKEKSTNGFYFVAFRVPGANTGTP
jgi:protocatechuate 3,4-dioxygenase beta subunit